MIDPPEDITVEQLRRHEGFRAEPYRDTEGHLTVGYGHNLDEPMRDDLAEVILRHDMWGAWAELFDRFGGSPGWAHLSSERLAVLWNMAFNMGVPRLAEFRRMWAAIDRQDYVKAADEMLDSRWAGQVGARAVELAAIMRGG